MAPRGDSPAPASALFDAPGSLDAPGEADCTDGAEQELDTALGAVAPPGAAKVYIWRFGKDPDSETIDWLRLPAVSSAGFDPDQIARRHGGGRFKFRFVDNAGRFIHNAIVSYVTMPPELAAAPAPAPAPGGSDDLLRQLLLQQTQFSQNLVLAIIGKGAGAGSVTEVLEAFKLGGDMGRQSSPAEAGLELFREGIKLARETENPAAGGSDMLGVAGHVVSMISKLLDRAPDRRSLPVAAAPPAAGLPLALPAGSTGPGERGASLAAGANVTAPPAPSESERLALLAQRYAPLLLAEAETNRDPVRVGEYFAERCPAGHVATLQRFLELEESERWDLVLGIEPRFADHRGWLSELCDGAGGMLAELYEGRNEATNDPGRANDPHIAGRNGNLPDGARDSQPGQSSRAPVEGAPGGGGAEPGDGTE